MKTAQSSMIAINTRSRGALKQLAESITGVGGLIEIKSAEDRRGRWNLGEEC